MAQIVLNLDSRAAEEVMFALKLRGVQKDAPMGVPTLMEHIRQELEQEGIKKLGWQDFQATGIKPRFPIENDIRVTITSRNRW